MSKKHPDLGDTDAGIMQHIIEQARRKQALRDPLPPEARLMFTQRQLDEAVEAERVRIIESIQERARGYGSSSIEQVLLTAAAWIRKGPCKQFLQSVTWQGKSVGLCSTCGWTEPRHTGG